MLIADVFLNCYEKKNKKRNVDNYFPRYDVVCSSHNNRKCSCRGSAFERSGVRWELKVQKFVAKSHVGSLHELSMNVQLIIPCWFTIYESSFRVGISL